MQWIEATIDCDSGCIDSIVALIEGFDVTGIAVEDEHDFQRFLENNRQFWDYVDEELEQQFRGKSRVKFYVENTEEGLATITSIQETTKLTVENVIIDDADWGNSWKQYYEPIPVGETLLIVPEWLNAEDSERKVIRLDPGIGFGTGSHPTTQMTLKLLEKVGANDKKVLDLGCGSGILGISALVLGCKEVTLCDIDPKARESVHNNMGLNGISTDCYRFLSGDLLSDERLRQRIGSGYNVILANIVADVIIPLSTFVRRFFADTSSSFLCSGVINERAEEVASVLQRNGFQIERHLQQEEWHAFQCRLSD